MGQQHTIGRTATTIRTEDGSTIVRYHWTDVVQFNADRIVLRTGGYRTATTKTRMNQAAEQFGLGFRVYQQNWEWFVQFLPWPERGGPDPIPFDGETLVIDRVTQRPAPGFNG